MLQNNKDLPKNEAGKFELHKVDRDSEGKERYIKTEEDEAIYKAKIQQMSAFAQQELRNATFDERCKWIEVKKDEGNVEFKRKNYSGAIDSYMAALCGFAFKKDITKEQKEKVALRSCGAVCGDGPWW